MDEKQTAIVLGAGDMPCAGIAIELARQGAHLILIDRDKEQLQTVQKHIQGFGGQATVYECDVDNPSAIARVAMKVSALFGCCDYLVNRNDREPLKVFSVKNIVRVHAEGSYAVGWVEKVMDTTEAI